MSKDRREGQAEMSAFERATERLVELVRGERRSEAQGETELGRPEHN